MLGIEPFLIEGVAEIVMGRDVAARAAARVVVQPVADALDGVDQPAGAARDASRRPRG